MYDMTFITLFAKAEKASYFPSDNHNELPRHKILRVFKMNCHKFIYIKLSTHHLILQYPHPPLPECLQRIAICVKYTTLAQTEKQLSVVQFPDLALQGFQI